MTTHSRSYIYKLTSEESIQQYSPIIQYVMHPNMMGMMINEGN